MGALSGIKMANPKVVILCGGRGTRLREETEFIPKPLVRIGNMPILWHIMKIYSHYGFNDFILCLGYKGDLIKQFFIDFSWMANDFTINLSSNKKNIIYNADNKADWNITFAYTGEDTETGGRIKKIEKYVGDDYFLATYGDGVADINIKNLIKTHKEKDKIVTVTASHPTSRFGTLEIDANDIVTSFREKPITKDWVSSGFFVFKRKIFDYLDDNDGCILERKPFETLTKERQKSVYKHEGFYMGMDTYKEVKMLNDCWNSGKAPWKIW